MIVDHKHRQRELLRILAGKTWDEAFVERVKQAPAPRRRAPR